MHRVRVTAAAVRDLDQIADYISGDNPEAAHRWTQDTTALFSLFAKHPLIGEKYHWRGSTCRRFSKGNFVIYFRPTIEGVLILRIVHGARKPPRLP
jgi:toxin ParE1/3/4